MELLIYSKYCLQKGDTLEKIGRQHKVNWRKDIYDVPANADFKKKFPNPDKIDYRDKKSPIFIYVPVKLKWDERVAIKHIKSLLPPFLLSESWPKYSVSGHARSISLIPIKPLYVCAKYDVLSVHESSFAYGIFQITYGLMLRGGVVFNQSGEVVFHDNIKPEEIVEISKEEDIVAISLFSKLSVKLGLAGIINAGLGNLGLYGKQTIGSSIPLGKAISTEVSCSFGGYEYAVELELYSDPDHGYLKLTFKSKGNTKIPCGLQPESFIRIDWKTVLAKVPVRAYLEHDLLALAFAQVEPGLQTSYPSEVLIGITAIALAYVIVEVGVGTVSLKTLLEILRKYGRSSQGFPQPAPVL